MKQLHGKSIFKKDIFPRYIWIVILGLCLNMRAQTANDPKYLTSEQKIWGLMQVWSTAKYNFAYFDRVVGLNWDTEAQQAISEVLSTRDTQAYYRVLQRLTAQLNDGHTFVMTPDAVEGIGDTPPVEFQFIEDKIVLVRIGMNAEIQAHKLYPGLELVEVDGIPAQEYYERNFASGFGGTKQWRRAMGMSVWLAGGKNSRVNLVFRDLWGMNKSVTLTRNAAECRGGPFIHRVFKFFPLIEKRTMEKGIVYFKLSSFFPEEIVAAFGRELDHFNLNDLKGMILDLRFNMGGNDQNAYKILSRLISNRVKKSTWKTREYIPFYQAWGRSEEWHEGKPEEIEPSPMKNYLGPLIVLIGPYTCSAAEDFLVPLVDSKRAILIGENTAGSTGQPLQIKLPGGGLLAVCTVRNSFPDGKEFVGFGIQPDIVVQPKQTDIFRQRDPVLDKAIDTIRHWQ